MDKLRRLVLGVLAGLLFSLPNLGHTQGNIERDPYNMFSQPMNTTDYYGSGDIVGENDDTINLDRIVNQKDYDFIKNNLIGKNVGIDKSYLDRADVDGNMIINQEDLNLIEAFIKKTISYLPGHWNFLQTRQERENWVDKMCLVDRTNELIPDINYFDCLGFSTLETGNFSGANYFAEYKNYTKKNLGRFNLPMYILSVYPKSGGNGHAIATVLVGDDPENFNDLKKKEPQDDSNPKPGDWDLIKDSYIRIQWLKGLEVNGSEIIITTNIVLKYNLDKNGNPENTYTDPDLILSRPTPLSVNEQIPNQFTLSQNYPNPFNASTIIDYYLNKTGLVKLDIYNIAGQYLESLVNNNQEAGRYSIKFDASKYSSGQYFYKLRTQKGELVKKLILLK
jgi:hypothetical protein